MCLTTMGISIHCNIRGVSTDWCSTLFRLVTSVFVFLFRVFRMASLVRLVKHGQLQNAAKAESCPLRENATGRF